MNRPPAQASVIASCATWHCACQNPVALQGRSGPSSGPTRDSAVVCAHCGRVYFVIPMDRSFGPPVEVVELFALPEPTPEPPSPTQPEPLPPQETLSGEATSTAGLSARDGAARSSESTAANGTVGANETGILTEKSTRSDS